MDEEGRIDKRERCKGVSRRATMSLIMQGSERIPPNFVQREPVKRKALTHREQ
jgi:hypothetical protein